MRKAVVKKQEEGTYKQEYVTLSETDIIQRQIDEDFFNSPEEIEKRRLDVIYEARNTERGIWQEQMEYLIDNGYDALKARDDEIKAKHPKEKR
jgi:hypothetical protein